MSDKRYVWGKPIDYNESYTGATSKLEQAILDNKISKALQLIRIGSNVNYCDKKNRTPLMAAAEKSTLEMCKFLIAQGAKLELKDDNGETAYLHACKCNKNPKVLEALENAGCNIYARTDEYNDTALFLAVEYNQSSEVIKYLLEKGFSVDDNDDMYHYTPLMTAAHFTSNPKVLEVLLEKSRDYDLTDKGGCTFLMHTAYNENDDPEIFYTVYNFLKKKEPNRIKKRLFKKDKDGHTMLAIAIAYGNDKIAEAINNTMKEYNDEK